MELQCANGGAWNICTTEESISATCGDLDGFGNLLTYSLPTVVEEA